MNTIDKTLAARFFFRNCSVSIHLPGELKISRSVAMGPGEVFLNRDFTPAGTPTEFIGSQSDFYRFLDATSSTNASIIKKLTAIGYMLCNKLPRGGRRCRAFFCVNEYAGSCANGKTLFTRAIAQLSNAICTNTFNVSSPFWLSLVDKRSNLLVIDDVPSRFKLSRLYGLCTDDWVIRRKCRESLYIPHEIAPYLLVTSDVSRSMMAETASFRRRFAVLEFSSFFSPDNTIRSFLGHDMFLDWDKAQWHMFDNLMFYCILEYLRGYARGEDIFSIDS